MAMPDGAVPRPTELRPHRKHRSALPRPLIPSAHTSLVTPRPTPRHELHLPTRTSLSNRAHGRNERITLPSGIHDGGRCFFSEGGDVPDQKAGVPGSEGGVHVGRCAPGPGTPTTQRFRFGRNSVAPSDQPIERVLPRIQETPAQAGETMSPAIRNRPSATAPFSAAANRSRVEPVARVPPKTLIVSRNNSSIEIPTARRTRSH